MRKIIDFKGLEGMLAFYEDRIGVVSNNYQFIAYNSFNSKFSDQIENFSTEYQQSPDKFRLGFFNSESYDHRVSDYVTLGVRILRFIYEYQCIRVL